ncbi:hypothetical protein GYMLUDRAFT_202677 [Collybiopsis luxurians FD-317 M1]|uniref:F-box domain-containing protein n=1 Tax=Collybiopsis luxurians FD-317 M1 TaxID=944289 RepID=A0A0D0C6Q5_9AGAR|nr:hypothetical protein GYMLUDRAFT_202677 [Collybiopsis luxurians FD-317 M1]
MPSETFLPRVNLGEDRLVDRLRFLGNHQRSEISSILQDVDRDLEHYSSEIYTLQAKLSFLESQRERLRNHKAALSSLLSPIHRLPNELLARILMLAGQESGLNSTNVDALSVAAVCYRWRQMALASSSVWSSFHIYLPREDEDNEKLDSLLEYRLDLFLERSGQRPLDLSIQVADRDDEHPLFLNLTESSPRWENLSLDAYNDDYPSLQSANLSSLKTVCIRVAEEWTEPLQLMWITSTKNLSTLSSNMGLPRNKEVNEPLRSFPVMHSVTKLTFCPEEPDFLEPLHRFPNIRYLGLQDLNMAEADIPALSHVILPITSLDILFGPPVAVSPHLIELAMDILTAPSLSSLMITSKPGMYTAEGQEILINSLSHIPSFLERSNCMLTQLVLKALPVTDQCVVDVLKHLHALSELTVEDPIAESDYDAPPYLGPISRELIESLHAHRRSSLRISLSPIVPKLRSLVLKAQSTGFDFSSFISTVASRWIPSTYASMETGVACLRSVELHLVQEVDPEDYLPLAPFEASGLRVVVKGK